MADLIDISDWKEFAFRDIFEIRKGFYNKKPEQLDKGDIPFLGATDSNNGVTGWYTLDEIKTSTKTGVEPNSPLTSKLFPGNAVCVTNNGSVGHAYFQPQQFTCSHDVNPLYRKDGEFNVYTGLFVATVIMHDKYRWQYGRKWRPARMISSKMRLPATASGDPDWQFMEDFIKSLNHKPLSTSNKVCSMPKWDEFTWRSFSVGSIFSIRNGRGITTSEIEENPGNLNAVQSGEENNGVIGKISLDFCRENNYVFTERPCLTVARTGSAGFVSFQADGCVVGDSAKILQPRYESLSTASYLFLQTVLNQNRFKFSYGRKVTEEKYLTDVVSLPVKSDDSGKLIIYPDNPYSPEGYVPDWQFMEDYMRSLPYGDRIPEDGD